MGCFIVLDYLIGFIVLIKIHAPWWAWLIYVVSVLVWLGIGNFSDDSTNTKTTDTTKQEQP